MTIPLRFFSIPPWQFIRFSGVHVRFAENGNLITTTGIHWDDDALTFSKIKGEAIARSTAYYMEYEWILNEGLIVKNK